MPTLDTKITAVTVFLDRARVTRRGTATLDVGAQTVTIAPLPLQLDESSVRAAGRGNARLTGLEVNRVRASDAPSGTAKEAQDKLEQLQDQDRILADEAQAWQARLGVIQGIGDKGGETFARNLARGKLSLEGLTEALDFLSQSHEAASNILRELAVRRRDLARQIEAAQAEADKWQNAAALETYAVDVNLEAAAAGPVELELTYTVYGASWDALYDVRLDADAANSLEWNYLAQVQQSTGEDWALPYALTLSTASLATGLDKPELPPWNVDVYRPPQPLMKATRAAAAPAPAVMAMAQPEMAQAAPMQFEQAQIASGGASVTYTVAAPRPIPSDGEPHQVSIAALRFDAALDYFTAPRADPHAFVRAKLANTSDYQLLAGDLALFHGADFVGTRALEPIVPGQEVELFLGADERIRVERTETEHSVDKNLLGNTGRTQISYRIRLQNPTIPAAHITVLDQIPVSLHPDIKVKLRDANPRPARQTDRGELFWELDLKQGAAVEITYGFTVEYPKEMRVAGV